MDWCSSGSATKITIKGTPERLALSDLATERERLLMTARANQTTDLTNGRAEKLSIGSRVLSVQFLSHPARLQTTMLLFRDRDETPSFLATSGEAASPLACLGFTCSNFAKKNKRLLAV